MALYVVYVEAQILAIRFATLPAEGSKNRHTNCLGHAKLLIHARQISDHLHLAAIHQTGAKPQKKYWPHRKFLLCS
jgi:hypothetical protein